MQTIQVLRRGLRSLWREERGVIMAMVLVLMALLMGVGATAIYSGYTNLQTSTNLKLAAQAKAQAEANVNEALYRLSLQETEADAIVPNLNNAAWQVEIKFTSGDNNASDGVVSTIVASTDWPTLHPDIPVVIRYKRLDPTGNPNKVLFYDPRDTNTNGQKFEELTLPGTVPKDWHPVYQILATAQDERGAERQILAEATQTSTFAPPAPLSSGVNVNLNGAAFIDGVNHHHLITLNPGSSSDAQWGDADSETTYGHASGAQKDSPDDHKADTTNCGPGGSSVHAAANPGLNLTPYNAAPYSYTAYTSCPRMFNDMIANGSTTPAWVGLTWDRGTGTWSGINTDYASAIALSNGPTVTNYPTIPSGVQSKGIFS